MYVNINTVYGVIFKAEIFVEQLRNKINFEGTFCSSASGVLKSFVFIVILFENKTLAK